MSALADRQSEKCTKETAPMSRAEAEKLLSELPGWKVSEDTTTLTKRYKFENFQHALDFTNAVGEVAERFWHHPDMKVGWGYVEVTFQTHIIKGLHINDFILAARVEQLAAA